VLLVVFGAIWIYDRSKKPASGRASLAPISATAPHQR
jgi:hypothetical protein